MAANALVDARLAAASESVLDGRLREKRSSAPRAPTQRSPKVSTQPTLSSRRRMRPVPQREDPQDGQDQADRRLAAEAVTGEQRDHHRDGAHRDCDAGDDAIVAAILAAGAHRRGRQYTVRRHRMDHAYRRADQDGVKKAAGRRPLWNLYAVAW
jgi:hypothetical protein